MDPVTDKMHYGDIQHETRITLGNIKRILAAAGASMADVVKCSVFLKDGNDFAAMNDNGKPIRGLYLSARTLKSVETRVLQPWILREAAGEEWEPYVGDWESFVLLGAFLFREVPTGFPLNRPVFGLLPELFLTDSERPAQKSIKAP